MLDMWHHDFMRNGSPNLDVTHLTFKVLAVGDFTDFNLHEPNENVAAKRTKDFNHSDLPVRRERGIVSQAPAPKAFLVTSQCRLA